MKVITEERLREIKESMPDGQSKLFVHGIITQCQELDTLTVTRLRPMSDIPDEESVILFDRFGMSHEGQKYCGNYLKVYVNGFIEDWRDFTDYIGWLPFPRYEPEKV